MENQNITADEKAFIKLFGMLDEKEQKMFGAIMALMSIEHHAQKAQAWIKEAMDLETSESKSEKPTEAETEPEPLNAAELALLIPRESDDAWKNEKWTEYANYGDVDIDISDKTGHGYIYIAEFGEYLKIGYTKSPRSRLSAHLQTAKNYGVITTGRVLLSPAHKDYSKTEKTLHEYFKECRKAGTELFEIAFDDVRDKIKDALSE